MKISSVYRIKVKQDIRNPFFDNIENSNIKESINNIANISVLNNTIVRNNVLSDIKERILVCKDVCSEYLTDMSIPSNKVPSGVDNYFLIKDGSNYTYTKDKPFDDIVIDTFDLLTFNNLPFSKATLGTYNNHVKVAMGLEQHLDDNGTAYKVYSFNFGGISKTQCFLFAVDYQNNIKLLSNYNEVLIDYLEGNVYIKEDDAADIKVIAGFFNIKTVKILKKGNFELKEKNPAYYKVINKSDKGLLNLKNVSSTKLVLTSSENIYIHAAENSITIDNVLIKEDYPVFVPKNTPIIIAKVANPSSAKIEHEDFVNNQTNIYDSLSNYYNPLLGTYTYKNNKLIEDSKSTTPILVYKEMDYNTYNLENPLLVNLFN